MTNGGAPRSGATAGSAAPASTAAECRPGFVGVFVALPREARTLVRRRLAFREPAAINPDLHICLGGIGMRGADAACRALLGAGATGLVSWGVAAGLDPSLRPGTLVVATAVIEHAMSEVSALTAADAAAAEWADRFVSRVVGCAPVRRGAIGAATEILQTVAAKRALAASGGIVADMETAGVARAARAAGVPWIAVRAVADSAAVALPAGVIGAIDDLGRLRIIRLAAALLRQPTQIPSLPAVARGFGAALRTLSLAAERAGPSLASPGSGDDEGSPRGRRLGARR